MKEKPGQIIVINVKHTQFLFNKISFVFISEIELIKLI